VNANQEVLSDLTDFDAPCVSFLVVERESVNPTPSANISTRMLIEVNFAQSGRRSRSRRSAWWFRAKPAGLIA
jgi:hypothetical protein